MLAALHPDHAAYAACPPREGRTTAKAGMKDRGSSRTARSRYGISGAPSPSLGPPWPTPLSHLHQGRREGPRDPSRNGPKDDATTTSGRREGVPRGRGHSLPPRHAPASDAGSAVPCLRTSPRAALGRDAGGVDLTSPPPGGPKAPEGRGGPWTGPRPCGPEDASIPTPRLQRPRGGFRGGGRWGPTGAKMDKNQTVSRRSEPNSGWIGRPSRAFPPVDPYVIVSHHTAPIILHGDVFRGGTRRRRGGLRDDARSPPCGLETRVLGGRHVPVTRSMKHPKVPQGIESPVGSTLDGMNLERFPIEGPSTQGEALVLRQRRA